MKEDEKSILSVVLLNFKISSGGLVNYDIVNLI